MPRRGLPAASGTAGSSPGAGTAARGSSPARLTGMILALLVLGAPRLLAATELAVHWVRHGAHEHAPAPGAAIQLVTHGHDHPDDVAGHDHPSLQVRIPGFAARLQPAPLPSIPELLAAPTGDRPARLPLSMTPRHGPVRLITPGTLLI